MKLKRIFSTSLSLALLLSLLAVPAFAEDTTLALREDWRLTGALDLAVPEGTKLIISGNGHHIYELGGKLTNSGLGVVEFQEGTILYPAANDTDANNIIANPTINTNEIWDTEESNALMLVRQPHAITIETLTGGTVTASAESAVSAENLTQAKKEATVTLTVDPNDNYALYDLTVTATEGVEAGDVTVTPDVNDITTEYTFIMPASDVMIAASFKPAGTTSVTVDMSGITLEGKTYDGTPVTYTGEATGVYGNNTEYSGGFTYAWYDESGSPVEGDGPVNAGTYTLRAEVDNEGDFGFAEKTVTIEKATVQVAAKDQSIYVGSAAPDLTAPVLDTHYTVSGLARGDTLGGAITMKYQAEGADATPDTGRAGTYDIVISGASVPAGGNYNDEIVYISGTLTIKSRPDTGIGGGGGGTPPAQSITVPISGNGETIQVDASVSGSTATVDEVDLSELDTVIGDDVDTGTVTIDFSGLDTREAITTVEIPSDVVKQIAEAVNDPSNDAESLEVILSDGTSIDFDAAALENQAAQADGQNITISIVHHEDAQLTDAQESAVGDRDAYDINVTSGGKPISNMGGQIRVNAPYVLREGEKSRGIVVYYVDENGNLERCETSYDEQRQQVGWTTSHLSLYMIGYDQVLADTCPQDDTCPVAQFTDTDPTAWYHDGVHYCVENGLMESTSSPGATEATFEPGTTTTRGMMVTLLYRLEGAPAVTGGSPFADVADGQWYTDAVVWAASNKIVNGLEDGTNYGPYNPVTREQMAVILYRYAQYKGYDTTGTDSLAAYTDGDETSDWAAQAMAWAVDVGLINGTSSTTLSPSGDATRAELATVFMRFSQLFVD